jgi:branched-chain amino acid transport system substrate-binding protein
MTWTLDRRTFLWGSALATLPLGSVLAQQGAPIRIGLLTVKSGPLATGGIQMEQGLAVFLKERNGTIAGRKVELIVADTGGNPAGAKTKVQEIVERDKIDIMVGPLAAFEALAINDYIRQAGVPTLSVAAAEDMTQRKPNPWFVRASATAAQACHPAGHYAAVDRKWKRVALISEDFAYGHEQMAGFQRVFEDNGGQITKKLWPPLNAADFSPYLAQITDVDAVFMGFAGGNGLKFMRQYAEFGLKDKIPLMGGITAVDESFLKNMGDEAVGVLSTSFYSGEIDTPSNKRLIADMNRDYQNDPGYYAVSTYLNGLFIEAALQQTNGHTEDKAAVMKALRAVSLTDTPRGPIHLDDTGNAVGNVYIREVKRKNGKLVNEVIKTYENVSQFWTYGKDAFLANPVYSRDYPPATHLKP